MTINLVPLIVSLILAYLIGGIPFGYVLVRLTTGKDVRSMGSGNIGATNVHRTIGKKMGVIVLLLDILKGFIAVYIASVMNDDAPLAVSLAALAVMAGHAFPIFLKFKGGKAVASFIGAFLYIAPGPLFFVLLIFVVVVAFSHYISLGSILSVLVFPIVVWIIMRPPASVEIATLIAGLFIVYRHKENIARLMAGNENRFHLKGSRS